MGDVTVAFLIVAVMCHLPGKQRVYSGQ